jgi:hypothetical protein
MDSVFLEAGRQMARPRLNVGSGNPLVVWLLTTGAQKHF